MQLDNINDVLMGSNYDIFFGSGHVSFLFNCQFCACTLGKLQDENFVI